MNYIKEISAENRINHVFHASIQKKSTKLNYYSDPFWSQLLEHLIKSFILCIQTDHFYLLRRNLWFALIDLQIKMISGV